MKPNREGPIVIAAGGTGGHLFPGQALAQELRRRGRAVALISDERVQHFAHLFPGADIHQVPSATPSRGGAFGLVKASPAIIAGIVRSALILGRIRPAAVIGFGGYPTLPPVAAALLRGLPTCVHEQNAVLGRVNRLVASHVNAIASTFAAPKYVSASAARHLVVTGNPVRDAVAALAGAPYEAPSETGPINLLVFGGSQGARVMSDVVPGALAKLDAGLRARIRLVQQCRPEDMERVRAIYAEAGIAAELQSFFDDMPARIAAAHLVIGRSGASTVSELTVIGRPSILVPLPHSIDNDQKANALSIEQAGAGFMIEQKDFSSDHLATVLAGLFAAPKRLARTAEAALGQGRPDAVRALADLVEALGRGELGSFFARSPADRGADGASKFLLSEGGV
ncbi:MAG: undecaprenyldiphospho-muramoylpentapeptide beta-N-acetylglucosaminyltransferase [Parvibaculaceae bacterium]|nr:undecaprenyldiphospho-muramoylpentapeptide beta-N-acetylglucosaminyltransferase [Parvibaculaceae bacterium]